MSLPAFSTQSELFSTAGLSGTLFAATDRYRLFGQKVYPALTRIRAKLEACYCVDNGRIAIEPVLLLGVSLLQYLEGTPDRQAVDLLRYHTGWNFALNRHVGDELFHPTTLVNFRQRLLDHDLSTIGFEAVLEALLDAGLVARQCRQRLDSTQMFGRISRMNRLDGVRETLRLALQELEVATKPEERPIFWTALWERYVESQVDYRANSEALGRKMGEAGADVWQLLEWLRKPEHAELAAGPQARLLARVFGEQFEVLNGKSSPLTKGKETVIVNDASRPAAEPKETVAEVGTQESNPPPSTEKAVTDPVLPGSPPTSETAAEASATQIQPKGKGQLSSDRVQNPHDPDATYAVKGEGQHKKEHVGYKVQVAESVSEAILAPGEPTSNFIMGIVTHPAYESDDAGEVQMKQEQAKMGLEKPTVEYLDGAYISAQQLARAQAEGRELIGPAQSAPRKEGRFTVEDFQINVEKRQAICPAGKASTQCSRLEEESTGKVSYRFEFSTQCHGCPLRAQCLGQNQSHRTVVVGEHHTLLQARRKEQKTDAFKERMKHRNAIEGTQSELVRAHGMRRARYRGLDKVKLQNYFIGAACNVKRWMRRAAWKLQQAASAVGNPAAAAN
jgi:hypothetical protein